MSNLKQLQYPAVGPSRQRGIHMHAPLPPAHVIAPFKGDVQCLGQVGGRHRRDAIPPGRRISADLSLGQADGVAPESKRMRR